MTTGHKRTLIFFAAFFLLLVMLHTWDKLDWFDALGTKLMNPIIHTLYTGNVRVRSTMQFFTSKQALVTELEELKSRTLQLEHVESTNAELLKENTELKKHLNFFKGQKNVSWQVCNVVGKNLDERTSGSIIDCGHAHGVRQGYAVVAGEGILVGKIADVSEQSSVVRFLNDSRSRIAAAVHNQSESIGIVQGGFGIGMQLTYIPQNEELVQGETVVTSGSEVEEGVQRGLTIGTLEFITKEPDNPFQSAVVRPPLNYQKLLLVSVVIPQEQ